MDKKQARSQLGIGNNEKVILFFGFVREYKGLKHLICAMPKIVEKIDGIKCLIVGDFGDDKEAYIDLIQKTGCKDSVAITEGYIPDKEVEKYFAACCGNGSRRIAGCCNKWQNRLPCTAKRQ